MSYGNLLPKGCVTLVAIFALLGLIAMVFGLYQGIVWLINHVSIK